MRRRKKYYDPDRNEQGAEGRTSIRTRTDVDVMKLDDNILRISTLNIVDKNGDVICGTSQLQRTCPKIIIRSYPKVKEVNKYKAKEDKVLVRNTLVCALAQYQGGIYFSGVSRPYYDSLAFNGYMNDKYIAIIPRHMPDLILNALNVRLPGLIKPEDAINVIRRDTSQRDVILMKYDCILQTDPKDRNGSFTDDLVRAADICRYILDSKDDEFRTIVPSLICERAIYTLNRRYIKAHVGVYARNGDIFVHNKSRDYDNPYMDEYAVKSFIPYATDVNNLLRSWNARTLWTTLLTYSMSYPYTDDQKMIDLYLDRLTRLLPEGT